MLMWNVVVRPSANHIPPALEAPRGVNGKRKLPSGFPPVYNPAASSVPANSVPQFMNFALEKRQCRPVVPMQKQEQNYTVKSFAGLSFVNGHFLAVRNNLFFQSYFSLGWICNGEPRGMAAAGFFCRLDALPVVQQSVSTDKYMELTKSVAFSTLPLPRI